MLSQKSVQELAILMKRFNDKSTDHFNLVRYVVVALTLSCLAAFESPQSISAVAAQLQSPTQVESNGQSSPIESATTVAPRVPADLMIGNQPLIMRAEAYAGDPYGVGRVSFRLRRGDELIERVGATVLDDTQNRIFYPIVSRSAVKTFIQTFTGRRGGEADDLHTYWFLFTGDEPLNLTLHGSGGVAFEVPVERYRSRQFERLVKQWWQTFNRVVNQQIEAGDYPPLVETYLTAMLGRKMGLEVSAPFRKNRDPLMQTFELMFDAESLRGETIREAMLNGIELAVADQSVPEPIQWSPVVVNNLPPDVEVEPIAKCVPEECFYLRFGTWENQLWLQRLMEEFGGDLSRMIQVRGFKYKIQSKFLTQLAIQSNEWDRLFGGNLIDDVAVIGSDTYFNEGSAVGVMLHAKSTQRLKNNLTNKRTKFAKENRQIGAKISTIKFGDHSIQFLSTPDNRYRSFYAVSGDCHLMTTSLAIAQRFLEAGNGIRSLADSAEYQFARFNMPLDRDDTVFVYLSTRFLQQLLTPQYQIELRRRNRIVTDITLLEMAKLAAGNEGHPDMTLDELIRAGYLPEGFGFRADGGECKIVGDHWSDSIRGRRGFFAPIPDLPLIAVTAEEASWFKEQAAFFAQSIRSLDPMLIAIKRFKHRDKVERVVFDARLAPFGEEKYGWLISMLGQPLKQEIAPSPADIIRLQVSLQGATPRTDVPAHQIFAAVQDQMDATVDLQPTSFIGVMQAIKEAPGYLGAWPNPGYTNWMPALGGQPDPLGYTYSRLLNLWRLQWNDFSVISFDQNRLEALKPHLKVVESERPAQVRLIVGDLAHSQLSNWANSLNYRRSWQTSIANVRLLNLLTQQFRVSPTTAKAVVERMLDVELVCSLGGEYELVALPTGRNLWHSSAWPSFSNPKFPDGHVAPVLKWFRGLEVEVSKTDTQFSVHGFLDIERTDSDKMTLPSFDLFQGFGNLFNGEKKPEKKDLSESK